MSVINKMNVAIFISGGGTTMQQVLRACHDNRLKRIRPFVISSNFDVPGVQRALDAGLPAQDLCVISRNEMVAREFEEKILSRLASCKIDAVMMCGFLPLMPAAVINVYRQMIFNQHPVLLDNPGRLGFGGKGMHGRAAHHALLYFQRRIARPFSAGCTIHRTTEQVDKGAIVAECPVEILPEDDTETLAKRVLPFEHTMVIAFLHKLSEFGRVDEMVRLEPLIQPGEEALFHEALDAGRKAYPNG